ncbi:MAG: CPBP family intramembrane glutamic endopeptidase [Candidatus Bathyarchaeia archaeon]|jgi:hypothetical protein
MDEAAMLVDVTKLFTKMLLVIMVLLTVFLYGFSIALQPILFYFTQEGLKVTALTVTGLPVWFFNKTAYIPMGINLGIVFLGIWSVFVASFVAAWKLKDGFYTVVKESLVNPIKKSLNSCLFAMPIINSMTLIVVLLIQSIQEVGGIPTGTPSIPANPFEAIVDLSYASVTEEIIFRLVPIGALVIAYVFWNGRNIATASKGQLLKIFVLAPFFPDKAKKWAGTKTVKEHGIIGGISIGEWGMVVITAAIFGLAHFNPGVSWELGKISSAAAVGLVLATIYIVYGIQASILMHWFFNAFTDTFVILSDMYPLTTHLVNLVMVTTYMLGLMGWIGVAFVGIRKLANRQKQSTSNLQISFE